MPPKIDMTQGPALPPNAWLRFDIVRRTLESARPGRALEIGPGSGAMAVRLVTAGHDYVGVEMSDESRALTTQLVSEVPGGRSKVLASTSELEGLGPFDLLCAFEVLEHIDDDVAALSEWVQHLSPGATVIFSVPAWQERFSSWDAEVGHLRRYSPEQATELARAAGLTDVDVTVYGFGLGDVLEFARNAIGKRRLNQKPLDDESAIDRTQRSGRLLQPPPWMHRGVQAVTWPFRVVQRQFPTRGTGLVLTARVPQP